ncbi:MAG TPA: type II toxin-antitoxin system VapC family toxin [Urbifossiella sp.]|nr:type II toxin-antitoxin system VapC family toxin [Urbifossiella sp.]
MADHFLDTSALAKHYRMEAGTDVLDALLANPNHRHFISRLAVVEFHSALAKLVRTGLVTLREFDVLTARFRADVKDKRFEVVRVLVPHFRRAEECIRRLGVRLNLRTLDAIQLAIALVLNESNPLLFVTSDRSLSGVASSEGLSVLNPELFP